ncbi:MAG: phosphatidate cytidylyltransferase, partial [Moorella sp. (in: Bacteria)]|nr:phosphatidate cytidylyltransferase [Moorella sp. (in: firmicutes)]
MLGPRVIVALVGVPVVLGAAWAGGLWLFLLVLILAFTGMLEFYRLAARLKLKPVIPAGLAGGMLIVAGAYYYKGLVGWLAIGLLMVMLLAFLIAFPRIGLPDLAVTLLGCWYIAGLLAHLLLIRFLPGGSGALILTFFLTWANDTGAYFCGRFWGRRHPWPKLSPGKTWAGAVGGLLLAVIVAGLLGPVLLPALNPWLLTGLAIPVAIVAQVGDLVESGFKRQAGVKDSGW